MKVFIAANDSYGLYLFRRDLIRRMTKDGHEVFVSLPDGDCTERIKELGCVFIETSIDRRGINPKTDARLLFTYHRILKTIQPNLVVTYTIKPNIYCGLAAKWLKIPYAVNITGLGTAFQRKGLLKTLVKCLYRTSCDRAKVVFTENAGIKEEMVSMGLFPETRIHVLNGAGVNTDYYSFAPYPETDNPVKFLFIGRVMKEKGIDEFLSVARRLKQEGYYCEFHLAGSIEEDYHDVLRKMEEKGIIVYHGFMDDVRPLIAACHCFVLPSYHEGMANTLLECGAMGRPLITSDINGCMEAVNKDISGFLVPTQDEDSLYKAMLRFVSLPYVAKKEMGKASNVYICSGFDKKQVVEETVKHLY